MAGAAGASVYLAGVLLGLLVLGRIPRSVNQDAGQTASPSGMTAGVQPPFSTSDAPTALIVSNAPAPVDVVLTALRKAASDSSTGYFDLHDKLCDILRKVPAEDFPRLWQAAKEFKSGAVHEFVRSDLIAAWAKLDSQGALEAAQSVSSATERESAVVSVLAQWSLKDRKSALQYARQIEAEGQRDWAVAIILRRQAEADPENAARMLDLISSMPARDRAASAIVGGLAGRNPGTAMAVAEQIRSSTDRSMAFSYIAEGMLATDPAKALEWAQGLTNSTDRTTALYIILGDTARSNPQRAVELLMAQPGRNRDEVVTEVAYTWAAEDPQAAARWACRLAGGEMQNNALSSIIRACPAEDLKSVGELALSLLPDGSARSDALKEFGKKWQDSLVLDARGALDIASQFPAGADRDAFLAGACSQLHWDHPEEMAKLVEAINTPKLKDGPAENAATSWLASDPEAAAAWSTGLPAGSTRERTLLALTKKWAATDPEAASQWFQTLPDDPQRPVLAEAFIGKALVARPDLAAAVLPAIPDETKRARLLQKISTQWLQKDPEGARAWLQTQDVR